MFLKIINIINALLSVYATVKDRIVNARKAKRKAKGEKAKHAKDKKKRLAALRDIGK